VYTKQHIAQKMVSKTYKKLDQAMEDENCELIESIGYEASNRMGIINEKK
jgi:hypothetical protein